MAETALELEFELLPGEDDLPCDDGEPLETNRHGLQIDLLVHSISLYWQDRDDYFAGGNMFLYYSMAQTKKNDFRGPDFFLVLDTERRDRKSWVVWKELRTPYIIIELTSDSTRREDHTIKKDVYARQPLSVPLYFIYDPETGALEGYRLESDEQSYLSSVPHSDRRFPCKAIGLELGAWNGPYMGFEGPWLRWFTPDGEPVPTPEEVAAREAARADEQAKRAEEQAKRAEEQAKRAEEQAKRAEEHAKRAEEQAKRAENEAERRRAAEARIAALEALLAARETGQ